MFRRAAQRDRFRFDNVGRTPSPFLPGNDSPLDALGDRYLPSKRRHNYLPHYWRHLGDIRHDVTRVLEIGVQTDRSLRMWEEFFPNALIVGVDIDPACKQFERGRVQVFIGDQSDREFLLDVDREAGPFDVVIDDGSHKIEHQLATFEVLFPRLTDHGVYVVEDTGGVVGDTGLVTVSALQSLVESVMWWPPGFPPEDWPKLNSLPDAPWVARNTVGVAFYRWIVFVMRGHNPEDNPYLD